MTTSQTTVQSRGRGASREAATRTWAFFIPGLSILLFTLVITLPWGFGSGVSYVPPLLIMSLIFAWTVRYPRLIPTVLVFLVGVAVDVVTASPVGYWAFLFLIGYACALHVARWEFEWITVATVVAFVPVCAFVGVFAWALTSAYFGEITNWQSVYDSVHVVWFASAIVVLLVRWCGNWMARSDRTDVTGATAT